MIFLTLGTQLPFDRLARAVDEWAAARGQGGAVFGQIPLAPGSYRPRHFEWVERIAPEAFRARAAEAELMVAHAGMGSIIAALSACTPILVMPRRADLGEQRNDHQVATARRFGSRPGIAVAETPEAVWEALDAVREGGAGASRPEPIPPFAEASLIAAVRAEIDRA